MLRSSESLLKFEEKLWADGVSRVAGVDEAGRGPLAGPVVAAAVVFSPEWAQAEENGILKGLTDSKQLTESRRRHFFNILTASKEVDFGIGISEPAEIDRINILQATYLAMERAVRSLKVPPDHILVDGLPVKGLPCLSTPIVKGDSLSLSIAAASVIAKVTRDGIMVKLHQEYPQYGFDSHKGYGSRKHMRSLLENGPSSAHRTSFRPVREAMLIRSRKRESHYGQMEFGGQ